MTKILKRFSLGMIVFLLSAPFCLAQITISVDTPPVGDPVTMKMDSAIAMTALKLDQTGQMEWTFNDELDTYEGIFQNLAMGDTPDANAPGLETAQYASHVFQFLPAVPALGMEASFLDIYSYNRLGESQIEEIGTRTDHPMLQGSPFVYKDVAAITPNPLTTGTAPWTERREFNPKVAALGFQLDGLIIDSSEVEINAWGNLTIPAGTFECIRVKRHEFRFLYAFLAGFPTPLFADTVETYTYQWLTANFQTVLMVTAAYTAGEHFTVADVVVRAENGLTGCDPDFCAPALKPETWILEQNHPNPFNPSTMIPYTLQQPAHVEINIFNLMGQNIARLENGTRAAGLHNVEWNGQNRLGQIVPSGTYIYQLKAIPIYQGDPIIQTRKMILTY